VRQETNKGNKVNQRDGKFYGREETLPIVM